MVPEVIPTNTGFESFLTRHNRSLEIGTEIIEKEKSSSPVLLKNHPHKKSHFVHFVRSFYRFVRVLRNGEIVEISKKMSDIKGSRISPRAAFFGCGDRTCFFPESRCTNGSGDFGPIHPHFFLHFFDFVQCLMPSV